MKISTWLLATTLMLSLPLHATEVAGVKVESQARLQDGSELILNGAGIRKKLFFKIYVGALYLAQRAGSTEAVLKDPGAKRVLMHFLYDSLSAQKLVDAWNDGFTANLSGSGLQALQPRIDAFNALFQAVKKGDEIRIDYLPGDGTQVWYGDQLQGSVQGEDFQRAVMSIWLGDEPADSELKEAMLGR